MCLCPCMHTCVYVCVYGERGRRRREREIDRERERRHNVLVTTDAHKSLLLLALSKKRTPSSLRNTPYRAVESAETARGVVGRERER